jgi:hypothetical protein
MKKLTDQILSKNKLSKQKELPQDEDIPIPRNIGDIYRTSVTRKNAVHSIMKAIGTVSTAKKDE